MWEISPLLEIMIWGQLVNYELPVKRKEVVEGQSPMGCRVPAGFRFPADLQACVCPCRFFLPAPFFPPSTFKPWFLIG